MDNFHRKAQKRSQTDYQVTDTWCDRISIATDRKKKNVRLQPCGLINPPDQSESKDHKRIRKGEEAMHHSEDRRLMNIV